MGSGTKTETYYDILDVASDCSEKDIKSAYVKLSKKYHPDVKGSATDQQQTARFVKISEAYQTLSKVKSRQNYDDMLKASRNMKIYETGKTMGAEIIYRPWEVRPDYDPNPGPYYGIKGLPRIPNFKVAAALVVLGIFGGIIGVFSVRHSFATNQEKLDKISAKAMEHHRLVLSEVQNSTKDEQMRRFLERVAKRPE